VRRHLESCSTIRDTDRAHRPLLPALVPQSASVSLLLPRHNPSLLGSPHPKVDPGDFRYYEALTIFQHNMAAYENCFARRLCLLPDVRPRLPALAELNLFLGRVFGYI
jgi:hypothetical protein